MQEEHPSQPTPQPAKAAPSSGRHRRRTIIAVSSTLLVLLLACLAVGACILSVRSAARDTATSARAIRSTVDQFMRDMAARDSAAAYALFSATARESTTADDLDVMLQGSNFALFDGYQDISVTQLLFTAGVATGPDIPSGKFATISGTTTYSDGSQGTFQAVLREEEGQWRLFRINVVVPPSKVAP